MPSQINNPGNVGYAEGITVSANYLKAAPSTQFGTRQLSVLTITKEGVGSVEDYLASDSLYSKVIRALQQTAEIWAVFTPVENGGSADYFNVIISADSQWTGTGTGTTAELPTDGTFTALEAALNLGAGTTGIVVTTATGFDAPFHG